MGCVLWQICSTELFEIRIHRVSLWSFARNVPWAREIFRLTFRQKGSVPGNLTKDSDFRGCDVYSKYSSYFERADIIVVCGVCLYEEMRGCVGTVDETPFCQAQGGKVTFWRSKVKLLWCRKPQTRWSIGSLKCVKVLGLSRSKEVYPQFWLCGFYMFKELRCFQETFDWCKVEKLTQRMDG